MNRLRWPRLALLLGTVFALASCATSTGTEPEHAAQDATGPAPIAYVAPELRPGLLGTLAFYDGEADWQLNAQTLSLMRQASARRDTAFLPAPPVEERTLAGPPGAPPVPVYLVNAGDGKAPPRPAILHMHGGGFVLGSARAAVPNLQGLAARHDCVVVTVEYRLAPETPFPGSLQDNYAALQWLYDNAAELGVDRARILVMGDSAGGGHAAMLALAARDRGGIPLAGQVLIYPMLDDRTGSTVRPPYWMGYGAWTPQANVFGWTSLLGVPAGSDAVPDGAVPAREDNLAGLPPTFIGVGSVDLFADENIAYARRMVAAGVPTELLVLPGAYHGFQAISPDAPLAQRFNAAIDAAIARMISQQTTAQTVRRPPP